MSILTRRVAAGAVAVAAVVGFAAASVGPVEAASTARSATEYFVIASTDHSAHDTSANQTFIAHGLFAGGGRDDATHDNYDVLHFGNGSLILRHPQSAAHFTFHVNPKTCFASFALNGSYTLGGGTGHYRGVTGHGSYRGFGQTIEKRNSAGKCADNALPKDAIFVVQGSGPATMP